MRLPRRSFLSLLGGFLVAVADTNATQHQGYSGDTQAMRVKVIFGGAVLFAALEDSLPARDLVSLLPLDLVVDDYSTNEKIAYLPRKLLTAASHPITHEVPGDLCYYAPWGNLVFFYAPYRSSPGLIRLGRLEGDVALIHQPGRLPVRLEPAPR